MIALRDLRSLRRQAPSARQRRRWADCIDNLLQPRLGVSRSGRLRVPEPNLRAARESLKAIMVALRDPGVAIDRPALASVITLVCDPTAVLYQGTPTSAHWEALRIERLLWLNERTDSAPAEVSTVLKPSHQVTHR
jgi:hypothetical protein